jgi:uncharacterized membrane protein YbhN (UPF0104 family)
MVALSHKAKQYGWFALKVFILFLAFWFVYQRLAEQPFPIFKILFSHLHWNRIPMLVLFVFLTIMNWSLEILKWQKVSAVVKKLSFKDATRQSLVSLTVSLATPNRIGEYGAKAYFFESKNRKKILLLTLFSNTAQMMTTVIVGTLGFILIEHTLAFSLTTSKMLGFIGVVLVLLVTGYVFRKKELMVKGFTVHNVMVYYKELPMPLWITTLGLSFFRYLIFCTLFYLILHFLGAQIEYVEALPYIFLMYLLVSIVPMFMIFDVVIRGSVAVWLFGFLGVNEIIVLATVLLMWSLNFVIPAIFGSFLLLKSPMK